MVRPPLPALALGTGGLLPALASCVMAVWGPVEWRDDAATVCATYLAIVLSFLGGAWWGLASRSAGRGDWPKPLAAVLAASVLPSLAAWAALLIDRASGLVLLGLLFLAVLPGDAWLARGGLAPSWWLTLRVPLSVGMAALALITGAARSLA